MAMVKTFTKRLFMILGCVRVLPTMYRDDKGAVRNNVPKINMNKTKYLQSLLAAILLVLCSIDAVAETWEHSLSSRTVAANAPYSEPFSISLPNNAILTNVQTKFEYIAYGGYESYVSVRLNKGSDPGSGGGALVVAQGSLPASSTAGSWSSIYSASNWNGLNASDTYYVRFAVADGFTGAPTIKTVQLILTYTLVYPDMVSVRTYLYSIFGYELTSPKIGDQAHLYLDWRVDTQSVTGPFYVNCYLDGSLFSTSQKTGTWGISQDYYYHTPTEVWNVTAGSHNAYCTVDANSNISESNESNNTASNSWNVASLFDLVHGTLDIIDVNGNAAPGNVGDTVYFKHNYSIQGSGPTAPFNIACYMDGSPFKSWPNVTGNGGQLYSLTTQGYTVAAGSHTVSCDLDSSGLITESNENNNNSTTGWTPLLINPTVSVTPSSGQQGTVFSEPGTGFSPNGGVTLHFKQPDGTETPTTSKQADVNGAYSNSWTSNSNSQIGIYYYWAVDNITSKMSNTTSFVVTSAAVVPALTLPAISATITTKDIMFQWSTVTNATSYELLVDNISGFGSPEINVTGLTTTTYTVTNYLPTNVYYWKVRAKLSDGSYTSWSDPWQFTYSLPVSVAPVWVPLYRMYNNTNKDHFYTTVPSQRDTAKASGYTYEKIEAYISDRKFNDANCGYLFRLYNPTTDVHFYTSSEAEKDNKIAAGYTYEGIVGFLYTSATEGASPLYFLENTANTDNFYTISKFEYNNAISSFGFVSHGAIGYLSPAGLKNPVAQNRPQGSIAGIDTATGAFRPVSFTDLSLTGAGPQLTLTRYYNSNNFLQLPLGPGWSLSLTSYIAEDVAGNVMIKWGDGTESYFINDGSDNFSAVAGNFDTLTRVNDGVNDGYNLVTKDQTTYSFRKLTINMPAGSPIVPSNYLMSVVDKYGNKLSFAYTADSGLLYRVDKMVNGATTVQSLSLAYNTDMRLTTVTDTSINRSITFGYDSNGNLATSTDARGSVTNYAYNTDHMLTGITLPEGNSMSASFDGQQRITGYTVGGISLSVDYASNAAVSSSLGTFATYVHDSSNRVTEIKDANLKSAIVSYGTGNLLNLPQTVTDRNTNATSYTYDARGNVLTSKNALNQTTTFTYDDKNNVLTATDPRGNTTTYTYDANKINLTSVKLPMNGTTTYTYLSSGLVSTITDPNNHSVTYTYDANGNPTRINDNSLVIHVDFTYDNAGRLLSKTDQLGRTTSYTYDANNNLTQVKDSTNHSATYAYDRNNRLTSITDFRGKATSYTYNSMNVLATETDPAGKVYQYSYDNAGRLSTITAPDGHILSYTYDANNRMTAIKYDGVAKVSFTLYDSNGNLKTMTDGNGTTSFTYDALNRMASYSNSYVGSSVSYGYDASGNRTGITYPGSKTVSYTYDGDNRLTTVFDWLSGTTTYTYDSAGILKSVTNPNGTTAAYAYDAANRLISLANKYSNATAIANYSFTLNSVGIPTQITKNEPLTPALPAADISYAYDNANKITTAGGLSYTFDDKGNLSLAGGNSFTFDFANRMTQSIIDSVTTQYLYDGFGNRISRTKGGVQTKYLLDLNADMSQVLAEINSSGNITNYYVYGLGLISKITAAGDRYVYHYDNIGNTIAITDSSGTITEKYAYDEFGKALSVDATNPNMFRYVGKYGVMDEGNGLLFMRARYYDVENGRFISKDPIGFEGGDLNLYAYVGGNPLVGIDPGGLTSERVLRAIKSQQSMNEVLYWEQEAYLQEQIAMTYERGVDALMSISPSKVPKVVYDSYKIISGVKEGNHEKATMAAISLGFSGISKIANNSAIKAGYSEKDQKLVEKVFKYLPKTWELPMKIWGNK